MAVRPERDGEARRRTQKLPPPTLPGTLGTVMREAPHDSGAGDDGPSKLDRQPPLFGLFPFQRVSLVSAQATGNKKA